MSTVKENRLFKVRELVEKSGGGSSFAHRLGLEKQYVSQIAGKGPDRKGIGDAMARKIEREFGLPPGYLDHPPEQALERMDKHVVKVHMLEVAGSNKNQEMAIYKADAVSEIVFFRPWMRQNVNADDHDRMNVATVRTDKMAPTFTRGDIVLIDTSISEADEAGIYVFERGRSLYINRLQPTLDGLKVLSDNKNYDLEVFKENDLASITIYGRVAKYLNWGSC